MNQKVENWDEADEALQRMGEIDIKLETISGELTLEINKLKEAAKEAAAGLESERKYLEDQITHYCERQKAEFAKKRSRQLNFGTIGFRITTSVPVPRDKSKLADLLAAIKRLNLSTCIKTEEKIDREQIASLDDGTIVKLGLKKNVKDSFRIQPNIEKIKDLLQAV